MNVEFLIKDNNGAFIKFDKNNFELIESILYSNDCKEEYENILFSDRVFINKLPFYEFKITTDEDFNAMYFEFSEGVEFNKYSGFNPEKQETDVARWENPRFGCTLVSKDDKLYVSD